MPYKLYLDKNELFECEVSVKNASLKGSVARLVVESKDGMNFVFNGKIENGKCNIPIRRLKGLLDESAHGNMFLEVIIEDTYFKPWQSEFIVEEHTSVKVQVNEQKQSSKPIVEVKVASPGKSQKEAVLIPLYEIIKLCEKFNIKKSTIARKKKDFYQLLREYFSMNPEFSPKKVEIFKRLPVFIK